MKEKNVIIVVLSICLIVNMVLLTKTQRRAFEAQQQTQRAIAAAHDFSVAYDKLKAINADNMRTAKGCIDDVNKLVGEFQKK